jgi:Ran GTPase-activating protein (RanGAP) involved in mRNA processing and transport
MTAYMALYKYIYLKLVQPQIRWRYKTNRKEAVTYETPLIHFFTQTLTILDLSGNRINAVGAKHLADALAKNTVIPIFSSSIPLTHLHSFIQTLTTLNLYKNDIGDKTAQHLADALAKNTVILIFSSSIPFTHTHSYTQDTHHTKSPQQ